MDNTNQHSANAALVITREFNAPQQKVFNAFAEAEALAEWWGPPGFPITVVAFNFRPGGVFHYKASMQGQTAWGRFVYGQISRYDLLEFTSSFSNGQGGVVRAPFSDKFPMEIFNRLEFKEQDGKTTITLTGYPVNATEEEMQFYASMTGNMQQGFAGTLAQLEKYLLG
ncbi:MAG TPA: SRPBCC domain-containing protein [Chitinophagaceae bacterium]|nr:SRPBCC domain-containing protein [Chitinophagaceae bacterium]